MTRYFIITLLLLAFPFRILANRSVIAEAHCAAGQSSTASLSGTIIDGHGGVIGGAAIVVENVATRIDRQATSNDSGFWVFPLLSPGSYNLTVRCDGFAPVQ